MMETKQFHFISGCTLNMTEQKQDSVFCLRLNIFWQLYCFILSGCLEIPRAIMSKSTGRNTQSSSRNSSSSGNFCNMILGGSTHHSLPAHLFPICVHVKITRLWSSSSAQAAGESLSRGLWHHNKHLSSRCILHAAAGIRLMQVRLWCWDCCGDPPPLLSHAGVKCRDWGALLRQCSVCDGNLTWRHDLSTEKVRVREIIASLTTNMNIWLWVFAPNGRLWPAFYQPNVVNIGMISNILRGKTPALPLHWWMMTLYITYEK